MSYYEVYQLEPKFVHMPPPSTLRNEHQASNFMSTLCEIGLVLQKRVVFRVDKVTETFEHGQLIQHREIVSKKLYNPVPPNTLHHAFLQELRDAFLTDSYKTDSPNEVSDELLEAILSRIPEYTPTELACAIQGLKENVYDVLGIDDAVDISALTWALEKSKIK